MTAAAPHWIILKLRVKTTRDTKAMLRTLMKLANQGAFAPAIVDLMSAAYERPADKKRKATR